MSTTIVSVLLGIAGMFGWGVYDFLGGVFARRIGAFRSLFWSQVAGVAAIGLVGLLLPAGGAVLVPALALVPVAAALYCAGYLFFFTGFEKGNVSIVAATMNLWAVFTMLVAFVLMGQRLTGTQTVGVAAILVGATLASLDRGSLGRQGPRFSHGVREAVSGAFFFGVYWNVSEIVAEQVGWLVTTVLVKFTIVVLLLGLALAVRRRPALVAGPAGAGTALALMGVVEVAAVSAVNYGLTIGDAILITPIASALSVVTIALAVIVLKDRISTTQSLGVVLAVAGIVTTAF